MMCVDCKNTFIYYYCRNCNCFLCRNCKERYDSFHFNHKSCIINPENLTECMRLYIKIEMKKWEKEILKDLKKKIKI